jgi:hypothetical protein
MRAYVAMWRQCLEFGHAWQLDTGAPRSNCGAPLYLCGQCPSEGRSPLPELGECPSEGHVRLTELGLPQSELGAPLF